MKIFEYERLHLGDRPKIKIESIEDKVKFLVMVLKRLRVMYIEEAQERVEQVRKEEGIEDVPYPLLHPVPHPVPYPLAGREKAMECGRTP